MTTTTKTLPDGRIEHYCNGELHDPAPGTPAVRYANGSTMHYRAGRRQDPAPGVPAVSWADGTTVHYQAGRRQDPAPGVPAVRQADGEYEHYRAGDRVDPSDVVLYEDWECGYCLRINTAGHIRAGCRSFATVEAALAHWDGRQPDYVRALREYVDTLTVGDA